MTAKIIDLSREKAIDHIHRNFVCFGEDTTIEEMIAFLRKQKEDGRIIYYYVIDGDESIVGVLPVRLLVTKDPASRVGDVCLKDIVTVDSEMTLRAVARVFDEYRYLSLPVVDGQRKILGVIDLHVFSEGKIDVTDRKILDEVFQTIGLRLNDLLSAGLFKSFRLRFPWLISTLIGGTFCALLSTVFELTLLKSVLLTVFLSMILALGESAATQSMTIILQLLSLKTLSARSILPRLVKEAGVGLLLGLFCAAVVTVLSVAWKGLAVFDLVLLASVPCAVILACVIGMTVPWLLYRMKANIRVSSGPIALALADVCTIAAYLLIATAIL